MRKSNSFFGIKNDICKLSLQDQKVHINFYVEISNFGQIHLILDYLFLRPIKSLKDLTSFENGLTKMYQLTQTKPTIGK